MSDRGDPAISTVRATETDTHKWVRHDGSGMVEIVTGFEENTVGAVEQFAEIASTDPLVAALLLSGAILTGFSVAVFGVATLGAIGGALKRGLTGSEEPNQPA
jgi:hypothetical protein